MIKIKASDIEDELTVCPYCMDRVQVDPHRGCCGEVHSETAYLVAGYDYLLLESEVEIEN